MKFAGDKTSTRFLEQNILNLGYAQFEGVGKYDFPQLDSVSVENLEDIPLQGFNFALKEQNPRKVGVHFFLHDYQFERVWNYPDRYIELLQRFAFVLSPDFSQYQDMPSACRIYNMYRNRWCARYWQDHNIAVIPTVSWSDNASLEYCLDGIPKHSTIAISTMGDGRWGNYADLKSKWPYIIGNLQPTKILLYGKDLSNELSGNIVFKKLISSKVAV